MNKRLIVAVLVLLALAFSTANAERWYESGYFCDGCRTSADEIEEPWVKVRVRAVEPIDPDYSTYKTLHYCGECRVNPEQQRKLGANLMKNGRWVKE